MRRYKSTSGRTASPPPPVPQRRPRSRAPTPIDSDEHDHTNMTRQFSIPLSTRRSASQGPRDRRPLEDVSKHSNRVPDVVHRGHVAETTLKTPTRRTRQHTAPPAPASTEQDRKQSLENTQLHTKSYTTNSPSFLLPKRVRTPVLPPLPPSPLPPFDPPKTPPPRRSARLETERVVSHFSHSESDEDVPSSPVPRSSAKRSARYGHKLLNANSHGGHAVYDSQTDRETCTQGTLHSSVAQTRNQLGTEHAKIVDGVESLSSLSFSAVSTSSIPRISQANAAPDRLARVLQGEAPVVLPIKIAQPPQSGSPDINHSVKQVESLKAKRRAELMTGLGLDIVAETARITTEIRSAPSIAKKIIRPLPATPTQKHILQKKNLKPLEEYPSRNARSPSRPSIPPLDARRTFIAPKFMTRSPSSSVSSMDAFESQAPPITVSKAPTSNLPRRERPNVRPQGSRSPSVESKQVHGPVSNNNVIESAQAIEKQTVGQLTAVSNEPKKTPQISAQAQTLSITTSPPPEGISPSTPRAMTRPRTPSFTAIPTFDVDMFSQKNPVPPQLDVVPPSDSEISGIEATDNARWAEKESMGNRTEEVFKQLHEGVQASPSVESAGCIEKADAQAHLELETSEESEQSSETLLMPSDGSMNSASARKSWRSILPFATYKALLDRYGATELQRQGTIWELCETEQSFVKCMRVVLRLFVQPLRKKDSKEWILGVPSEVSCLFDWLEDIVHLHNEISSSLDAARADQYPVVLRIAEILRPFIPRLEIHQPFLVNLNNVSKIIQSALDDPASDLGELFRIQSTSPKLEDQSLPALLTKPMERLMQYTVYFAKLLQTCSRSHPDYLATFSLFHSTRMIVHVMQDVRTREEEYEAVKAICERIEGLPSSAQIATRERRLLAQGAMQRKWISDKERDRLEVLAKQSGDNTPRDTTSQDLTVSGDESSDVPGEKDSQTGRRRCASDPPSSRNVQDTDQQNSLRTVRTHQDRQGNRKQVLPARERAHQNTVYVFVFTDLILMTTPMHTSPDANALPDHWQLVESVGVCRVLSLTDLSGCAGYEHLLAIDLLPVNHSEIEGGILPESASPAPLYLSLTGTNLCAATKGHIQVLNDARQQWLAALEKCCSFTVRSLAFPSHSGGYHAHGTEVDNQTDIRQTIMSLLASGLPFPKSPSMQIEETQTGGGAVSMDQEREQRGWWVLRFQQVLRETQRMELTSSLPLSMASQSFHIGQ